MPNNVPQPSDRREHLWRVIFLSDTRAGKIFDVVLLWIIGLSVLTLVLVEGPVMDCLPSRCFQLCSA